MSTRPTLVALLAAAACGATLLAFVRPAPAPALAAAPVAGWEYHIVRGGVDLSAPPKTQDEQVGGMVALLNQLGAEGWELTAIQGSFAVLRRPR